MDAITRDTAIGRITFTAYGTVPRKLAMTLADQPTVNGIRYDVFGTAERDSYDRIMVRAEVYRDVSMGQPTDKARSTIYRALRDATESLTPAEWATLDDERAQREMTAFYDALDRADAAITTMRGDTVQNIGTPHSPIASGIYELSKALSTMESLQQARRQGR